MANNDSLPDNPGLFQIICSVVVSTVLGAVLACVWLASRPVETVKALPKEPVKGKVYYIAGSTKLGAKSEWRKKTEALLEKTPGEVVLTEGELNTWVRSLFKEGADEAAANESASSWRPQLKGGIPSFRIVDGQVQIGAECDFRMATVTHPLVLQLRGTIEREDGAFIYKPSDVWIGGLHASNLPGKARTLIIDRLLEAYRSPAEVRAAWAALGEVKVEDHQLTLTIPSS